ncbi:EMILIN-1-like [Saccostrea cucullata]|uniref:EMILIN-1-like n=1 Tax=Saccostrea cuccullata TaxID=36930 RepID=UPI002ED0F0A5
MSTSEDIKSLEDILTFEIEQTIRDSEEKMMKNVCAKITDLELRDRYLSLSLLDVHNNTARLSSSLSSLEAQQKQMKSEIQTLTNSQQHDITKLNDTITHLKNRVQSRVAFTAGILEEYDKHHTYTGTVKFAKVIYQVGGGYNPTTGVFTAPKAGLYLIFCTNVAYNHETFWTRIMINGSSKAGVMAYVSGSANVFQSASNLVVHQLQVGDRVWIEVHEGSHLYSVFPETTFSVIMINGSD